MIKVTHINLSFGELCVNVEGQEAAENRSQVPTEDDHCVHGWVRVQMPLLKTQLGIANAPTNMDATD